MQGLQGCPLSLTKAYHMGSSECPGIDSEFGHLSQGYGGTLRGKSDYRVINFRSIDEFL